jgi:hypothetical protein
MSSPAKPVFRLSLPRDERLTIIASKPLLLQPKFGDSLKQRVISKG